MEETLKSTRYNLPLAFIILALLIFQGFPIYNCPFCPNYLSNVYADKVSRPTPVKKSSSTSSKSNSPSTLNSNINNPHKKYKNKSFWVTMPGSILIGVFIALIMIPLTGSVEVFVRSWEENRKLKKEKISNLYALQGEIIAITETLDALGLRENLKEIIEVKNEMKSDTSSCTKKKKSLEKAERKICEREVVVQHDSFVKNKLGEYTGVLGKVAFSIHRFYNYKKNFEVEFRKRIKRTEYKKKNKNACYFSENVLCGSPDYCNNKEIIEKIEESIINDEVLFNKTTAFIDSAKAALDDLHEEITKHNKERQFKYEIWKNMEEFPIRHQPISLAVDYYANVWVANEDDMSMARLSPRGIQTKTEPIEKPPSGIAIDKTGNIWVVSRKEDSIIKILPSLRRDKYYEIPEKLEILLKDPSSIAIDPHEIIWIANTGKKNLIKFNPDSKLVNTLDLGLGNNEKPWGFATCKDNKGGEYLLVSILGSNKIIKIDLANDQKEEIEVGIDPCAIAVDSNNNIWVANYESNSLTKLSFKNNKWSPNPPYHLNAPPSSIAIDSQNKIWVTAHDNTLIKINQNGKVLKRYLAGVRPQGLAIDKHGNIWLINECNSSIIKLKEIAPKGEQYFPFVYSGSNDTRNYPLWPYST